MTTLLTLGNTVSAFVRGRNRWESAVRIPIEIEQETPAQPIEQLELSKVRKLARRLKAVFSEQRASQ